MKIKLAILEKDLGYLNRIVSVFNTKYADNFEIYSFTDEQIALATLDSKKIDVFVASDAFEINVAMLPKRCGFAYFVDSPDIETIHDEQAICKFQKVELIYKQILSVYSENAGDVSGLKLGDDSTKVVMFCSPCGGVGSSTVAAACALHYAARGKRTLYLNLEKYGSSDLVFNGEGQFDFSDIIYALKSKKTNLSIKLESCVKQASNGVCFYSQPKVALDMLEINEEDIIRLISELSILGAYEYIIVDIDFGMSKDLLKIYKRAHSVIWVGDGSNSSNSKIQRAYNALSIIEQNEEAPLVNRLGLIYNRFSSKTSTDVGDIGIRNIGGAPVYLHADIKSIAEQLATMEMFEHII